MSGLAHFLEDEGISTVVIALVREHAEQMRPPRALAVPFMLGRPFGEPDDPPLQTAVLRQAFELLAAESGPILVDADVPEDQTGQEDVWVCPVSFPNQREDSTDLNVRVEKEIAQLRSWYELGVERRGRTTVGLSPVSVDESAKLIARYLEGPERPEVSDPQEHRKLTALVGKRPQVVLLGSPHCPAWGRPGSAARRLVLEKNRRGRVAFAATRAMYGARGRRTSRYWSIHGRQSRMATLQ